MTFASQHERLETLVREGITMTRRPRALRPRLRLPPVSARPRQRLSLPDVSWCTEVLYRFYAENLRRQALSGTLCESGDNGGVDAGAAAG